MLLLLPLLLHVRALYIQNLTFETLGTLLKNLTFENSFCTPLLDVLATEDYKFGFLPSSPSMRMLRAVRKK